MGLKQQLLDAVKKSIPTFDEENDYFVIEFEAGGDSFGSFTHFDTDAKCWEDSDDDFNLDEHLDLIISILDESGIEYVFAGGQMLGKIIYSNETLKIESEYLIDGEEDEDDPDEGWKFDYKTLEE